MGPAVAETGKLAIENDELWQSRSIDLCRARSMV